MNTSLLIGILSTSLLLNACEDPSANKARAVISQASASDPSAELVTARVRGERLAINPESSKILFTGSKVTGRHEGGFKRFIGTIDLVNARPEESRVNVEIETGSVFTDNEGLTRHLLTSDFFAVEQYPKASFASTRIVPDTAAGPNSYEVTGDLEFRGVTKSLSFPATITVGEEDVAVHAEFSFNRKNFGIVYSGTADNLIRDNVVITLDLVTPRRR